MPTIQRTLAVATAAAAGLALLISTAGTADAKARKRFRTNKEFGLGLMVGDPSGLAAKFYLGTDVALSFGLGSSHYGHHDHDKDYGYRNEGVHFHTDVLWHPIVLTRTRSIQLPLYIGVGGQVRNHDNHDGHNGHSHLGARVPFGIAIDFNHVPVDIFFEMAFAIDLVGPSKRSYVGGSLGARYYF